MSWTLSEDMIAENAIIKAWYLATNKRQINDGFLSDIDRGAQYAVTKITNLFSFNSKITQAKNRKDLRLRIKAQLLTK